MELLYFILFAYPFRAQFVAGNYVSGPYEVPSSHFHPSPEGGESSLCSYTS